MSTPQQNLASAIPSFDDWQATRQKNAQGIRPNLQWGAKRTNHKHQGLDYDGPMDSDVGSAGDGEVVFAGPNGDMGNAVKVKHSDGIITVYGHLNKVNVQQGDRVKVGANIGLLGQTGNAKGPHVHFEVYQNNLPLDPAATQWKPFIGKQAQSQPPAESPLDVPNDIPSFDDWVKTQQPAPKTEQVTSRVLDDEGDLPTQPQQQGQIVHLPQPYSPDEIASAREQGLTTTTPKVGMAVTVRVRPDASPEDIYTDAAVRALTHFGVSAAEADRLGQQIASEQLKATKGQVFASGTNRPLSEDELAVYRKQGYAPFTFDDPAFVKRIADVVEANKPGSQKFSEALNTSMRMKLGAPGEFTAGALEKAAGGLTTAYGGEVRALDYLTDAGKPGAKYERLLPDVQRQAKGFEAAAEPTATGDAEKTAQNIVAGGIETAPLLLVPGGPLASAAAFGGYGAAKAAGEGQPIPQVAIAGGKGALSGALLGAKGAEIPGIIKAGATGAGTYALERATGTPNAEALKQAAIMTGFRGLHEAKADSEPATPSLNIERAPTSGVPGEATANIDQTLAARDTKVEPTFLRDGQGKPAARVLNPDEVAAGGKMKVRPIHQADTQSRAPDGKFAPLEAAPEPLQRSSTAEVPRFFYTIKDMQGTVVAKRVSDAALAAHLEQVPDGQKVRIVNEDPLFNHSWIWSRPELAAQPEPLQSGGATPKPNKSAPKSVLENSLKSTGNEKHPLAQGILRSPEWTAQVLDEIGGGAKQITNLNDQILIIPKEARQGDPFGSKSLYFQSRNGDVVRIRDAFIADEPPTIGTRRSGVVIDRIAAAPPESVSPPKEPQIVKPYEMTREQIEQEFQRKKSEDDNLEARILGPELAKRYAHENGWDTQAISQDAVRAAGQRFSDPEDARFMLDRFLKKEQPTVPQRKQIAPSVSEGVNPETGFNITEGGKYPYVPEIPPVTTPEIPQASQTDLSKFAVDESPVTMQKKADMVNQAKVPAMLYNPGQEPLPYRKGLARTETEVGTWIHDPYKVSVETIRAKVADGSYHSLLGITEPKSAATNRVVTSRAPDGTEVESAAVSPGNEAAQAKAFQEREPAAKIEAGGPEQAERVIAERRGERSFPKTAEAAGFIGGTDRDYSAITDKESLTRAAARIERDGIDRAIEGLSEKKEVEKDDISTGILLMQRLEANGDVEAASDVASELSRKLTQAGQTVQAASIISRLSPEGVLLAAQKTLKPGQKLTREQATILVEKAHDVRDAEELIAKIQKEYPQIFGENGEVLANAKMGRARQPKIGNLQDRLLKLEQDARARLSARVGVGSGSQVGASTIPLDIADYAIIGASKLARSGISKAQWTAEMLKEFGDDIKPYIRQLYQDSYQLYDDHRLQFRQESRERSARRLQPEAENIQAVINDRLDAQTLARKARSELARSFNDLNRSGPQKFGRGVVDVANLPRALLTTADLSAGLRQGKMGLARHPKIWFDAFLKQFKALKTENYERMISEMETDPEFKYARRAGLDLTAVGSSESSALGVKEEPFQSGLVKKIPGVRHSEQAYNTMLDQLRFGWFKDYANHLRKLGLDPDKPADKAAFEEGAKLINNATGRGNLGRLNSAAPALNTVFFSPRFWASRLKLLSTPLDPRTYTQMSPQARVETFKTLFAFAGLVSAQLAIAKMSGAKVDTDPESPDFLKAKWGPVHVDFSAGFQNHIRVALRLSKALYEREKDGKSKSEPLEIVGRYARSKESPNVSLFHDLFLSQRKEGFGTDYAGNKTALFGVPGQRTQTSALLNRITPMVWHDAIEGYQLAGLKGAASAGTASALGEGISTYADRAPSTHPSRDTKESYIDRMRKGDILPDTELKGQGFTPAQIAEMKNDAKLSSFQVSFSNAHPDTALDRFERMDTSQRYQVQKQMEYKAKSLLDRANYLLENANGETKAQRQQERNELQRRLDALGLKPRDPKDDKSIAIPGAFRPPTGMSLPAGP